MIMRWLILIRKAFVTLIGSAFILAGIAMIVLPGPAFIFIPLGIAILALEFAWAKRALEWMKKKVRGRRNGGIQ